MPAFKIFWEYFKNNTQSETGEILVDCSSQADLEEFIYKERIKHYPLGKMILRIEKGDGSSGEIMNLADLALFLDPKHKTKTPL